MAGLFFGFLLAVMGMIIVGCVIVGVVYAIVHAITSALTGRD